MPHPSRSFWRALVVGVAVSMVGAACSTGEPAAGPTGTGAGIVTTQTPTTQSTATQSTATQSTAARSTATRSPATASGTGSGSGTATARATTTARPPVADSAPPVTLLGGVDIAWSVAVLPDGSALVSERNTGLIHHVPKPGAGGRATVAGKLPITRTEGEGGLLGLA